MADLRSQILINVAGNLRRQTARYSRSLKAFSRRGVRDMRALQGQVKKTSGFFKGFRGALIGIGAVSTVGAAGRFAVDFQARLARLRTDANLSESAVQSLKDEVFRVANLPDIRIAPDNLLKGVEQIVQLVGFSDAIVRNTENIGRAVQASGAAGEDVGSFVAELFKKGIKDSDQVEQTLSSIIQQGKEGAFIFREMARLGARLFAVYEKQGPEAVKEVAALAQVVRQATGSSEQATTSIEALFRTLSDLEKVEDIEKKLGVPVRTRDGLGKTTAHIRDITDIVTDLVEKTKGNRFALSEFFDAESMRVFNGLVIDGNLALLERLKLIDGSGQQLQSDSSINAKTAAGSLSSLSTSIQQIAERQLTPPITALAAGFERFNAFSFKTQPLDQINQNLIDQLKEQLGPLPKDELIEINRDFIEQLKAGLRTEQPKTKVVLEIQQPANGPAVKVKAIKGTGTNVSVKEAGRILPGVANR